MTNTGYFTDFVVFIVSVMGAVGIIFKYYFEAIWLNYKNPVAFYKTIVQRQVEAGIVNEDELTENFKLERPIIWTIKQYTFWLEVILMLLVPLPFRIGGIIMEEHIVRMECINWVDNSGAYPA